MPSNIRDVEFVGLLRLQSGNYAIIMILERNKQLLERVARLEQELATLQAKAKESFMADQHQDQADTETGRQKFEDNCIPLF